MIKEYKYNKRDTRKYLYRVLFRLLIYFTVLLALLIVYKEIRDSYLIVKIIIGVLIVWSILYLVPLFILYINHRINSNKITLSYDDDYREFVYTSSRKEITFRIDDIQKVEMYLTPSSYEKSIDLQYFGDYHYSKIFINKNESVNISCLVCDEIDDIIPKRLIKKKKKYIPIIG